MEDKFSQQLGQKAFPIFLPSSAQPKVSKAARSCRYPILRTLRRWDPMSAWLSAG
jgi:hypothetical protein